ncbi:hypothetical protein [Actinokineospora sp.]|uniref:hypothetical protein n=1 Tax=Actinokineospora sp. TaxID=1872133 RepID=UPI004037793B
MMALLDGVKLGERLTQLVIGDAVVLHVQAVEEGLVEQASLLVVTSAVEGLWIFQKREAQLDKVRGDGDVFAGLGQPFGEVLALLLDVVKLPLDLGFGAGWHLISTEVKQVVFPNVPACRRARCGTTTNSAWCGRRRGWRDDGVMPRRPSRTSA